MRAFERLSQSVHRIEGDRERLVRSAGADVGNSSHRDRVFRNALIGNLCARVPIQRFEPGFCGRDLLHRKGQLVLAHGPDIRQSHAEG